MLLLILLSQTVKLRHIHFAYFQFSIHELKLKTENSGGKLVCSNFTVRDKRIYNNIIDYISDESIHDKLLEIKGEVALW